VVGDDSHVVFGQKFPRKERMFEKVRFRNATASSFVAKVRGGGFSHFHTVAVRGNSSMRNYLLGLPGRILCEQSP
jgi:hypothetical protein